MTPDTGGGGRVRESRDIGSSPEATAFPASFRLPLSNPIGVAKGYLAEAKGLAPPSQE